MSRRFEWYELKKNFKIIANAVRGNGELLNGTWAEYSWEEFEMLTSFSTGAAEWKGYTHSTHSMWNALKAVQTVCEK